MEKGVIIFGAKSLGKIALDIFKSHSVEVFCFLDDDKSLHGTEVGGVSILSDTDDDDYLKLISGQCGAFVALEEAKYKEGVTKMIIERKEMPLNAIHSSVTISDTAIFGHGNLINAGAVINSSVKISNHCIINSNSLIDADTQIMDFVQVGAGAVINQGVIIEEKVFIGSGAIIVSGINIGKGARIGAGSLVISDVKKGETVFGNPAKPI